MSFKMLDNTAEFVSLVILRRRPLYTVLRFSRDSSHVLSAVFESVQIELRSCVLLRTPWWTAFLRATVDPLQLLYLIQFVPVGRIL